MAVWDSVLSSTVLLIVVVGLIRMLLVYVPGKGKFWYAIGLSFFTSLLCLYVVQDGLARLGNENEGYLNFLQQAAPVRWIEFFLVLAGATISSILHYQWQTKEVELSREEITKTMVRDAELQKIQMQLQPHFLFNSLNSINAMIGLRPDEAKQMVQQLSDFLRLTLKRSDEHWITLEEEWNYLKLYLSIEKVRFGYRLEVNHHFNEELMNWPMPTLLLQPLVENAIKFGLYGTTDKVTIDISGMTENDLLKLTVTNPYEKDMQPPQGSGFGLSGLTRRLYLLFARNDLLEVSNTENIFTVVLKIPKRA
jgi:LytS/YehU family sensor histidine kinase